MYRITNKSDVARVCVSRTGAQNPIPPNESILLEKLPKNIEGFEVEEVGTEMLKSETADRSAKRKIKPKEEAN